MQINAKPEKFGSTLDFNYSCFVVRFFGSIELNRLSWSLNQVFNIKLNRSHNNNHIFSALFGMRREQRLKYLQEKIIIMTKITKNIVKFICLVHSKECDCFIKLQFSFFRYPHNISFYSWNVLEICSQKVIATIVIICILA